NPLREGERLDEDRLLREPREDFAKKGWDVAPNSLEAIKFPGGEKAEFVEVVPGKGAAGPGGITRVVVATTLHRGNIPTVACPVRKGDDDRKCSQMVRRTLLSLRRLPDLPPARAPLTADDLERLGLTLKESLVMMEALVGEKWGALVNDDIATLQDRRLPRAAVLTPKDLLRHVRLHLLARSGDLDLGGGGRGPHYPPL